MADHEKNETEPVDFHSLSVDDPDDIFSDLWEDVDSFPATDSSPATCSSPVTYELLNPDMEWDIRERVMDWFNRRMKEKKYTLEDVQNITGVSRLTLYKLKKSQDYFISTPSTEEKLFKAIGNYGYPSAFRFLLKQANLDDATHLNKNWNDPRFIIKKIIDIENEKVDLVSKHTGILSADIINDWLTELLEIITRVSVEFSSEFVNPRNSDRKNLSKILLESSVTAIYIYTGISRDKILDLKKLGLRSHNDLFELVKVEFPYLTSKEVKNLIMIALTSDENRFQMHSGCDSYEVARELHSNIEINFYSLLSEASQKILKCELTKSIIEKLVNLEADIEKELLRFDDTVNAEVIKNLRLMYNSNEKSIKEAKKADLYMQYDKIEHVDIECDFCDIASYYNRSSKVVYISCHHDKRFGAIRPDFSENFEADMHICRSCLLEYADLLVAPISTAIKEIKNKWGLTQEKISLELEVNQGIISKIENNKLRFVEPSIIKKIYKILAHGSLNVDNIQIKLKRILLEKVLMSGFGYKNIFFNRKLNMNPANDKMSVNSAEYSSIGFDFFVLSDSGLIKIVCFASCENIESSLFMVAKSKSLWATHVFFGDRTDYSNDICLDIRHGNIQACSLPFNGSILTVRNIDEKLKYAELDSAIIKTSISDVHISSLTKKFFSYERGIVQPESDFKWQKVNDGLSCRWGLNKWEFISKEYGKYASHDLKLDSIMMFFLALI